MSVEAETVVHRFTKIKATFACYVRARIEARRRRIERDRELEREFYRKLEAYCVANNLSPVCEDDWRTGG
jgi:hypothetical protein